MSSIYGRLGFSFSDPDNTGAVQSYSANVNQQMTLLPPLLQPWQISDVANQNTGGYFQNPVAGITNNGDLMLKGGIVFGDNVNSAWRLSADGSNFLIQKSGEQGLSITSKGVVTPAPTLNTNTWSFPKF